jgi:hypothetical protein
VVGFNTHVLWAEVQVFNTSPFLVPFSDPQRHLVREPASILTRAHDCHPPQRFQPG